MAQTDLKAGHNEDGAWCAYALLRPGVDGHLVTFF
jgi:hypothetical protein